MAKALVRRELIHDSPPEAILESIHQVLRNTIKPRRMMTCCLGLLDPLTRKVAFTNAGHPFPFLFPKIFPPRLLDLTSSPLGVSKKTQFATETITLEPGERIILLTEGVIEALGSEGPLAMIR